jgi:hypothetical protein
VPATFLQPRTFTLWALGQLAGLIRRIELANTYVLTPDGTRIVVFSTKLHNRLLRPLPTADQPQKICQGQACLINYLSIVYTGERTDAALFVALADASLFP